MSVKMFLRSHKSGLMLFGGAIGFIFTNYLTAKGTIKYLQQKELYTEEELTNDWRIKAKLLANSYTPAFTSGLVSAGLIFGGNKSYAKTQAGLVSAYTLLNTKYANYRDAALNALGFDNVKQIEDKLKENISERMKIEKLNPGSILICDTYSSEEPRYLETTLEELQNAEYLLNRKLIREDYVTLNDWYGFLGFDTTLTGEELGWTTEHLFDMYGNSWIDIEHELVLEDPNYYIIRFTQEPIEGFCIYSNYN